MAERAFRVSALRARGAELPGRKAAPCVTTRCSKYTPDAQRPVKSVSIRDYGRNLRRLLDKSPTVGA